MLVSNLNVPGKVALAFQITVLLLHLFLSNRFDPRVEKVSKCNVPFHFVRYASRSVLHTKFLQVSMS